MDCHCYPSPKAVDHRVGFGQREMANGNKVNANPGNWSQFGLVGGQEGFLEEDDSDVLACCHVEDIPSPLVGRSEVGLPDSKIGIGNSPRSWIWFDALFSQVLPVSFQALILVTSIVGLLRAAATPLVRAVLQELLALWWGPGRRGDECSVADASSSKASGVVVNSLCFSPGFSLLFQSML